MVWERSASLVAVVLVVGCGGKAIVDSEPVGGATAVADRSIVTITSFEFFGRQFLVGMNDLDGSGYAQTPLQTSGGEACSPVFDGEGRLLYVSAGGIERRDLEAGGTERVDGELAPGFDVTPTSVAVDAQNRILGADVRQHRVFRVNDIGGADFVSFGSGPGAGDGQLDEPTAVAVTPSGAIVVADRNNGRVVQVDDMSGAGWTTWAIPDGPVGPARPQGLTVDDQGRIWVADFETSIIYRVDSIDGEAVTTFVLPVQQVSHLLARPDGLYIGLLNGEEAIGRIALDPPQADLFDGPEGSPFTNPCGIAVR